MSSTGSPLPAQWRKSTPYPVPEQRQLKTPQRGLRRAAGPGERLNAVQVVEKEFGEACFVLQHAGDKLVNVETAVEGDAAERQRQRNGFRAAQGFDFAAPAEANQQGVKGCKAPLRLERLERAPLATRRTRPDSSVKTSSIRLVSLHGRLCRTKARCHPSTLR